MSYPKKAKGWRSLTLNNQQFRWRFILKAEDSLLKLQASSSASQQAVIVLRNWRNPWLSTSVLPNELKILTAKFASQAVEFALQNGWKPDKAGAAIRFEYTNEEFVSL